MDQAEQDRLLAWAETLTTRLCHDVAGLAGTLGGTLEMGLGTPAEAADPEAAALAAETAHQLSARIRLFRAAWGGSDLDEATLNALADGLPNRSRLTLDLAAADIALSDGLLAPGGPRLLLCLLLAACAGLPHGGALTVQPLHGGGFAVTMAGRRAAWPDALLSAGPPALADARGMATPMALMVAAGLRWRLQGAGLTVTALPAQAA